MIYCPIALAGESQKTTPTKAATSNNIATKRTLGEAKMRDIRICKVTQFPSSHNPDCSESMALVVLVQNTRFPISYQNLTD